MDTTLLETKVINNQLFYMLEGTEEYGPEPVVQASEVAKKLGYADPDQQVSKIMKRNKVLMDSYAFLVEAPIDVTLHFGGAHKSKKPKTRARKTQKIWVLTEEGFHLFVSACKTPLAIQERRQMVRLFVKMRKHLLKEARKQVKKSWIEFRENGKETRLLETNEIAIHVQKSKELGSQHADMYYKHYTQLVYKALEIEGKTRDELTEWELDKVAYLEDEIRSLLRGFRLKGIFYKEAYKHVKEPIMEKGAFCLKELQGVMICQKTLKQLS